jgi:leucyl aminopeptidase
MKIKEIDKLENFVGTVIFLFLKLVLKYYLIAFEGIEISSKVFLVKKKQSVPIEKNNTMYLFVGLGKQLIMPTKDNISKSILQRNRVFAQNVVLYIPDLLTADQVEAII